MVAMIFTRCPRTCPTLVHDLIRLSDRLPTRTRARTRFVLVTMDPDHDTPAVLHAYRARMSLVAPQWRLLQGDPGATRELAAVLGFAYRERGAQDFMHRGLVTVLDRGGVIAYQDGGIADDPARVLAAIERCASGP